MKQLHKAHLYCWSQFDTARNLDFNSYLWVRPGGNVVIDPLPMSPHDRAQLDALGGAAWVVITNSDHTRDVASWVARGVKVAGPIAERDRLGVACDRWLDGEDELEGAEIVALHGSKTPGELALILEHDTLVTGDLIRGQRGGYLNLLPSDKLADPRAARESAARLSMRESLVAVLVGDGWPVFRDGHARLNEMLRE